jgi:hypothetical protein
MSKCDIAIELDQPDKELRVGDRVIGHVRIMTDRDTTCRGVYVGCVIRSDIPGGKTEQRGEVVNLFSGNITANQPMVLRFDIPTCMGPGNYRGVHLEIGHHVEARADIPWAIDPSVRRPIEVVAGDTEPILGSEPIGKGGLKGALGALVAIGFVLSNLVGMGRMQVGWLVGIGLVVGLLLLVFWSLFVLLPKWRLGRCELALREPKFSPGDWLRGSFLITPRTSMMPRTIAIRLTLAEQWKVGSGDEERTERLPIYSRDLVALERPQLVGGMPKRIDFATRLPPIAAYSATLDRCAVSWSLEADVAITGLSQLGRRQELWVAPASDRSRRMRLATANEAQRFQELEPERFDEVISRLSGGDDPEDELSFAETAAQFWKARNRPADRQRLVDGLGGLPLEVCVRLQRRPIRGAGDETRGGEAVVRFWGQFDDPPLPVTVVVPEEISDEFEEAIGQDWCGLSEVVGWDEVAGRLVLRVI